MNKKYTNEQIQTYINRANKYFNHSDWFERYGYLEPKEIAWDKMQEVKGNELYLLCLCHFPNCPTDHYVAIRVDKLNGREQVSCRACAKQAKAALNLTQKTWKAGDIVCETQKLIRSLNEKEKKEIELIKDEKYQIENKREVLKNDIEENKIILDLLRKQKVNLEKVQNTKIDHKPFVPRDDQKPVLKYKKGTMTSNRNSARSLAIIGQDSLYTLDIWAQVTTSPSRMPDARWHRHSPAPVRWDRWAGGW